MRSCPTLSRVQHPSQPTSNRLVDEERAGGDCPLSTSPPPFLLPSTELDRRRGPRLGALSPALLLELTARETEFERLPPPLPAEFWLGLLRISVLERVLCNSKHKERVAKHNPELKYEGQRTVYLKGAVSFRKTIRTCTYRVTTARVTQLLESPLLVRLKASHAVSLRRFQLGCKVRIPSSEAGAIKAKRKQVHKPAFRINAWVRNMLEIYST